jgi:two-component system, OmpR family, sensor kinase
VTVTDNGPGVQAEYLRQIFDRFYRIDTSRARTDGGTGLGLAIVQGIVSAHAGSVSVRNESDGGASFGVTLPQLDARRRPGGCGREYG